MFNNESDLRERCAELVLEYEAYFNERDNPEINEVDNLIIMYYNHYPGIYSPRYGRDFYLSIKAELEKRKKNTK